MRNIAPSREKLFESTREAKRRGERTVLAKPCRRQSRIRDVGSSPEPPGDARQAAGGINGRGT